MKLFLKEFKREVKQVEKKKKFVLDSDIQEVIDNVSSKERFQWLKDLLNAASRFTDKQEELIDSYKGDQNKESLSLEFFPEEVQTQLLHLDTKLIILRSMINVEINFCNIVDSVGGDIFKDLLNIDPETALIDQIINGIKKTEPLEKLENRDKVGKDEEVIARIDDEEFKKCISFFDEFSKDLNKGLKRFSMHIAGIMRPDIVCYVDKFIGLIFELINDVLYAEYDQRGILKKDFKGRLALRKDWQVVAIPDKNKEKQSDNKDLNMDPDFSYMGEA